MPDQIVIAVTGASRGIGAEITRELARRGFFVGALSLSGRSPVTTADHNVFPIPCDVSDETSLRVAFQSLVEVAGHINGLVNNAGIHLEARSHELTLDTFDAVMNVNARGLFAACREMYPHLEKTGGTIVNIGSFFDKVGVKRNVPYCASKAAVAAITRCLAVEWAPKDIRVLDVAPGYVETDLNREAFAGPLKSFLERRVPTGGAGQTSDVARLIAAIFEEDIPFLTGETIYIDGGQGIAL